MNLVDHTWVFNNAIPKRICDYIIKEGNQHKLKIGETGYSIKKDISPLAKKKKLYKRIRNSDICFFDDIPWVNRIIDPYIREANRNSGWRFDISCSEPFQFTKYALNQHYHWHQDSLPNPYPEGHKRAGLTRKVSTSIILSDKKDYKGGDLLFNYQVGANKIDKLKLDNLEVGSIVVFPSFLWHKVTSVTKGLRYSLVGWYLGENFR